MSRVIDISDDGDNDGPQNTCRYSNPAFNLPGFSGFDDETEGVQVDFAKLNPRIQKLLDPQHLGPFYHKSNKVTRFILGPVKMSFNSSRFYSAVNIDEDLLRGLKRNDRIVGFCVNTQCSHFWPRNFSVSVNNTTVKRPEPRFVPDSQFFWMDLSKHFRAGQNGVHVYGNQQNVDGYFYFAIRVFCELTDMDIVHEIEHRPTFSLEKWRELFRQTIENDNDVSFARNEISLICPLGLWRLQVPVRSVNCLHLTCFDLVAFSKFQREAGAWKCPICGCASHLEDLCVDECVAHILATAPVTVETVDVTENGEFVCRERHA